MAGITSAYATEGKCIIRNCTNNADLSNSNQSAGIAGFGAELEPVAILDTVAFMIVPLLVL